ncbi:MAG: MAPEG family protein [Massilia sp.]
MPLTTWVTLAAIALYLWTSYMVAFARARYKVKAPSMEGPPEFLVRYRVQMNTLEQLPVLLAPMWTCAFALGDRWAAAGGLAWCVGRLVYALAYYRDPAKRGPGFSIAFVASAALMVGTAVGLVTR